MLLAALHVSKCSRLLTTIFVFQQKLPRPEAAVDCGVLLAINVQVVVSLPKVPSLLHFSDGVAFTVLHKYGGVDEVEGPPHLENDLASCIHAEMLLNAVSYAQCVCPVWHMVSVGV